MNKTAAGLKSKKQLAFPHVLLIMIGLIIILCVMSYIVPAGVYDVDPATGVVLPESFHYVEQNPISPLSALFMLYDGIAQSGNMFALIMVIGGMIYMIISSNSVEEIIDYALWRLQEKGMMILIPVIMILISLMGTLAGNDSMITFIIVGLLFVKRLNLGWCSPTAVLSIPYQMQPSSSSDVLAQQVPQLACSYSHPCSI